MGQVVAFSRPAQSGMRHVGAHRFGSAGVAESAELCWVVEEQALFVEVADVGLYTMMWTPTDAPVASGYLAQEGLLDQGSVAPALALCAGFLLTECIIDDIDDVASMAVCPDHPDVVKVSLVDPARVRSHRRGGLIASSCGVCGAIDRTSILSAGLVRVPDTLHFNPADLTNLMQAMHRCQSIFNSTGGTHAAALFNHTGALRASAEDLGRHNALDKVIGQCLLRHVTMSDCCVTLSGRVSLELIVKAARAGIEIVAAVSAPSSLAIEVADQLGITLCGFVRAQRLTAFTHPHRVSARGLRQGNLER